MRNFCINKRLVKMAILLLSIVFIMFISTFKVFAYTEKEYIPDKNFDNFFESQTDNQNSFIWMNDHTQIEVVGYDFIYSIDYYGNHYDTPNEIVNYYNLPAQRDPNKYVLIKNGGVIDGYICDIKMYVWGQNTQGTPQILQHGINWSENQFVKIMHYGEYWPGQIYAEIHFYQMGTDFEKEVEFDGVIKGTGMVREYAHDAWYYNQWVHGSSIQCNHYSTMGIKKDQLESVYIAKDKTGKKRFINKTATSAYTEPATGRTQYHWIIDSNYICYVSDILQESYNYMDVNGAHPSTVNERDINDPGHSIFFKVHSTPQNPLMIYGDITCDGMLLDYVSNSYDPTPVVLFSNKEALYEVTRGRAGTGTAALIKNGGTDDYLPILSLKGGDTTEIVPDEQGVCSIFTEDIYIRKAKEVYDDVAGGLTATLGGGKTEILGYTDPDKNHLDFKTSDGKDAFIEFCKTTIELKEADNETDGIKPSIVPAIRLDYNNGEDPDWHNDLIFYTNDTQELNIPEDEDFVGWNTKYNGKGDWYGSEEHNGVRTAKKVNITKQDVNDISENQNTNIGILYAIYQKNLFLHSNY